MKDEAKSPFLSKCDFDGVTEAVISEFAEFCRIPRGSGREREITEYLFQRLKEEGFFPDIDGAGNLLCDIPPSEGAESAPLTALQGHVDMVCAVSGDSYDPQKDAVVWELSEDAESGRILLRSDGRSSLGADCGLGDAALLWLVLKSGCSHGPLRLIFTVEEEIGLAGAKKLDASVFDDVKYVINVDGFCWGRLIAGSAGGSQQTYASDVRAERSAPGGIAFEICLSHFHGGHSGYDIDKGRANAVKLLNELLRRLQEGGVGLLLSAYNGGIGHNVIPGEASAALVMEKSRLPLFQRIVRRFMEQLLEDYAESDPDGLLCYNEIALPEYVIPKEETDRLIRFVDALKDGVFRHMTELPEVVDTSSNLGMLRFCAAEAFRTGGRDAARVMTFVRSMNAEYHDAALSDHREAAARYGFREELTEYGIWRFDPGNPLISIASEAYREVTGGEPEVTAVHVGLEPSVFCEKSDHLHMINVGADVIDPHTVYERVHVDTIRPLALMLAKTLERIAAETE